MSKYKEIPKDLLSVKSKVAFGLTKRQLICFCAAAIIGVPAFFGVRPYVGNTAATLVMIALMAPGFAFGLYEKNGLPLEAVIKNFYKNRYGRPAVRVKSFAEGVAKGNGEGAKSTTSPSPTKQTQQNSQATKALEA
jgi:hypothetical protein